MSPLIRSRFEFFQPECDKIAVALAAPLLLTFCYDRARRAKVLIPPLPAGSDGAIMLASLNGNDADRTLSLVLADWCDENEQPHFASLLRSGLLGSGSLSPPRSEWYFPAFIGRLGNPGYATRVACLPSNCLPDAPDRGSSIRVRRVKQGAASRFRVVTCPSPVSGHALPAAFDIVPYIRAMYLGAPDPVVEGGVA